MLSACVVGGVKLIGEAGALEKISVSLYGGGGGWWSILPVIISRDIAVRLNQTNQIWFITWKIYVS